MFTGSPNATLINPIGRGFVEPHIDWLFKLKKTANEKEKKHINLAIILFSVVFFEGFLERLLIELERKKNKLNDPEKLKQIEGISSWKRYKKGFNGYELCLDKVLGDESKNIEMIFKLRNLIVHGSNEVITANIINEKGEMGNIRETGFNEIEEFFLNKKLIVLKTFIGGNFKAIFSDSVSDWVYKNVNKYRENIKGWLEKEFSNDEKFSHILKFL